MATEIFPCNFRPHFMLENTQHIMYRSRHTDTVQCIRSLNHQKNTLPAIRDVSKTEGGSAIWQPKQQESPGESPNYNTHVCISHPAKPQPHVDRENSRMNSSLPRHRTLYEKSDTASMPNVRRWIVSCLFWSDFGEQDHFQAHANSVM